MKCDRLSCRVTEIVLKQLKNECKRLCSKSRNAILRDASPDAQLSFNWLTVASEIQQEAPLLFAMLSAVGAPHRPRNIHK